MRILKKTRGLRYGRVQAKIPVLIVGLGIPAVLLASSDFTESSNAIDIAHTSEPEVTEIRLGVRSGLQESSRSILSSSKVAELPDISATVTPKGGPSRAALSQPLEVRVLSPTGSELEGITVRTKTKAFFLEGAADVSQRGLTNSDGVVFMDVPPGRVTVSAYREGTPLMAAFGTVACIGEGPFLAEIALEPTAQVAGRVFDEISGAAIVGAWVEGARGRKLGLLPSQTDENGEFIVQGWPVDVMTGLTVTADGFGKEQIKLAITNTGYWEIPARYGWELKAGNGGTPWADVSLVPEKAIIGEVVSGAGEHIENATVRATGRFLTMARMAHVEHEESAGTPSGHFELKKLRSDITHSVRISAPGYLDTTFVSAPNVVAELGQIVLNEAYYVKGVVLDGAGQSIPGIRVECESIEGEVPHPSWDPNDGSISQRDGFSGHFSARSFGYTDCDGSFELKGLNSSQLMLRFGQARMAVQERVILRSNGNVLDCGQVVIGDDISVVSCRVSLPREVVATNLEAIIAVPGGEAFSQVPCRADGSFDTWWPAKCQRADVLVVDPTDRSIQLELRGVLLEDLSWR